jgi:hypothetical protein
VAYPAHGFQKLFQPGWFGVKGYERIGAAVFRFVLWKPGAQRCREVAPKRIEPMVRHFKNATDVRWLALVKKDVRAGCVVVPAITAFEKFQ